MSGWAAEFRRDLPVEGLTVATSDASGGVATVPLDKVWVSAYSAFGLLGQVSVEHSDHGGPHVAYRVGPFTGSGNAGKPWGQNLADRAEGGAVAAGDTGVASVTLNPDKASARIPVTNEALADVHRLREKIVYGAGLALGLDSMRSIVANVRTTIESNDDQKVATGANAPTVDQIEELFYKVPSGYRVMPACGWVSSDANWRAVWKALRDAPDDLAFQRTRRAEESGAVGELYGKLCFEAPGVPAFGAANTATLWFGDLAAIAAVSADWRIAASSDGSRFGSDTTEFMVSHRFDADVVDPAALSFVSGA